VEEKSFICPKFLGLPDMVRHGIDRLPKLISPNVNLHKGKHQVYKSVWEVGKLFTNKPWKLYQAYQKAYQQQVKYQQLLLQGLFPPDALAYLEVLTTPEVMPDSDQADCSPELACTLEQEDLPLTIAVISHPYNLYDDHASMGLLTKLRTMGVKVLTPENVAEETIKQQNEKLPKRLFWSMGQRLVGSAFHYLERADVDGIIHMAAFGCGPDSFTGELIERELRRQGKKCYLNLTIDEHTGEAGVVTRLEAFLDMLQRRVAQ
jgi:predicted nucleotide-binding protein (sugar kinase/HSP70/actin superfamily)